MRGTAFPPRASRNSALSVTIMADELEHLEQTVEREMGLLRALPAEPLGHLCLEHVQAAVAREAARLARTGRGLRVARAGLGLAAAVLLALTWWGLWSASPGSIAPDPERLFGEWATAVDESSHRVAGVLEEGWVYSRANPAGDEAELDDFFYGLDQSFDQFEAL